MADKYAAVLLFGYPGCGKGTQGQVLGGMPNLSHQAMGDIFRALDKQSELGQEFLSYSTKGLLVPDDFTVRLFRQHIENLAAQGQFQPKAHMLLMDGIPRTPAQVDLLTEFVDVRKIVHLAMENDQALIARLSNRARSSGRPDDADENVIRKRIEVYRAETSPVLEKYDRKLIANINADQHQLGVLADICGVLKNVVPNL